MFLIYEVIIVIKDNLIYLNLFNFELRVKGVKIKFGEYFYVYSIISYNLFYFLI